MAGKGSMEVPVAGRDGSPLMPPIIERTHDISRARVLRGVLLGGLTVGTIGALLFGRLMWGPHLAFESASVCCFLVVMMAESRRRLLRARVVVVLSALLLSSAVAFPPRESADVWSYVMYGRIVLHGDDPYTTAPSRFPHDRWLRLVRPIWRDTPSLYGPLFNETAADIVRASDGSALKNRVGFQLLAALAVAGMLVALWRRTRDPTILALIGLNPLVVLGVVNGGHNDALVALAVLAGVLLAERNRNAAAGVALGVGALVKVVVLLPAGILLLWMWRRRGLGKAAVSTAALGVCVAAGYLALGGGGAWHALRAETGLTTRFSAWRLLTLLRDLPADTPSHYLSLAPGGALGWIPLAITLGVALLAALPAIRGRAPERAVGVAVLVYLLAGLYVSPWYVVWVLPVLAVAWPWRVVWVAMAQQSALTVAYALALHRHFGPVASAARVGYFDALSAAQAAVALALGVWGVATMARGRSLVRLGPERGPAPEGRPSSRTADWSPTAWLASSTSRRKARSSGS
jgi:hypothetical protein